MTELDANDNLVAHVEGMHTPNEVSMPCDHV